jgi:hypothetical protein
MGLGRWNWADKTGKMDWEMGRGGSEWGGGSGEMRLGWEGRMRLGGMRADVSGDDETGDWTEADGTWDMGVQR